MLRITTHIERLLLVHDCVIIPGVGGFVLQTVPSVCRKDDHTFLPMYKEIVFNKALQYNDGLLAESYMQAYQTDYRKAQLMVEEDVTDLKATLQQYDKVSLGHIGTITQGAEGQLIFQTGKADRFDVDYYGLTSFHFPALPPIQEEETTETGIRRKKDIFYIPINMRFVRGAVASAAAIALFFLISTPVKDVKQSAYTASILPCEILMSKTTEAATSEAIVESAPIESATPEIKVQQPTVAPKMYHIIIGSFPDQSKADDYLANIDKSLYQETGMIVRDDRYRVYARKFDNREMAEKYLDIIRQSEKYKDAWLFISR